MQEEKDYYAILGISRSSNEDDIKRAYFELINKFSTPDANPSEKEKVRQISEAYNILSNSEKKKL